MDVLTVVLAAVSGMFLGAALFCLIVVLLSEADEEPLPPAPETESEPPDVLPFFDPSGEDGRAG